MVLCACDNVDMFSDTIKDDTKLNLEDLKFDDIEDILKKIHSRRLIVWGDCLYDNKEVHITGADIFKDSTLISNIKDIKSKKFWCRTVWTFDPISMIVKFDDNWEVHIELVDDNGYRYTSIDDIRKIDSLKDKKFKINYSVYHMWF